jgi:hypothetical protein
MLFMAEELHAQAIINRANIAGVCFVGDAVDLPVSPRLSADETGVILLQRQACAGSEVLSALLSLQGMDTCYQAVSLGAIRDFASRRLYPCVVWPSIDATDGHERIKYAYGTTVFLQQFYQERGHIPFLSMKPRLIRWALGFFERYVSPSLPVVVHLKNNPHQPGQSNANLEAWFSFFQACLRQHDVTFILIGKDDINDQIRRLPNVMVTQDMGSALNQDLALIQSSFAFMGMASGPCNMALLSDVPYIIFKNPDHHAREMALELGEADRFPFAREFQKILRVFETDKRLMSEFEHLYMSSSRQDWEKRLDSLRQAQAQSGEAG